MISTFNFDCSTSLTFFDKENKMALRQPPSWNPTNYNKGDAIGRNYECMVAWGDEEIEVDGKKMLLKEWLMEGVMDCWVEKKRKTLFGRIFLGKTYLQGYRYPTYARGEEPQPVGLSRDHTLNTVRCMQQAGWSQNEIWAFVRKLRFRISKFALFTINLWLWMRVISGRKLARIPYYPIEWAVMGLTAWWNTKVEKFTGIGPHHEVTQFKFKHMQNKDKPEIINKCDKALYPTYAMLQQAEQITHVNEWWAKRMRKFFLKIVPKYNYVIQLYLRDPNGPSSIDVDEYEPMAGGRWSGNLNKWWNDRSLYIIPEDHPWREYNQLDVDLLKKLYIKYGINP